MGTRKSGWKDNPDKKDEYIKIVNSIMTDYDNSKVMNEVIRQTSSINKILEYVYGFHTI